MIEELQPRPIHPPLSKLHASVFSVTVISRKIIYAKQKELFIELRFVLYYHMFVTLYRMILTDEIVQNNKYK